MDIAHYKKRLLETERELTSRATRAAGEGREQTVDYAHDAADLSTADEAASAAFTSAEVDATTLDQVRAALGRIDSGTFGRCIVDGAPIDEKRLDAMPWTPYCLKHQQEIESAAPSAPPTM